MKSFLLVFSWLFQRNLNIAVWSAVRLNNFKTPTLFLYGIFFSFFYFFFFHEFLLNSEFGRHESRGTGAPTSLQGGRWGAKENSWPRLLISYRSSFSLFSSTKWNTRHHVIDLILIGTLPSSSGQWPWLDYIKDASGKKKEISYLHI